MGGKRIRSLKVRVGCECCISRWGPDCAVKVFVCFVLFYLPYLSSIHEKANCIAILWTVSPHSLGSCLFFFEVYGSPVFHMKVGRPVKCLAQGHNKRTCRLVLHNLP